MSNSVNKSDFYYGSFLSKVLEKGNKPALLEKSEGRGIYNLKTNKDDYTVYIKYASNSNKNIKRWTFNYTESNIEEIRRYIEEGGNIIFSYICSYDDFRNCEIAIADLDEFMKCINPECKINKSNSIKIYKKPHSPILRMYGTARADEKYGEDNTIHLERNRINNL